MSIGNIQELHAKRFRLLRWIYEATKCRDDTFVDLAEETDRFGWDLAEMDRHARYLGAEGLVRWAIKGLTVFITHAGIKAVERAMTAPDRPTAHFLALNLIFAGSISNSQIQPGTTDSSQARPASDPQRRRSSSVGKAGREGGKLMEALTTPARPS